ncbi:unnamed protein product [Alopecurus aequalis]
MYFLQLFNLPVPNLLGDRQGKRPFRDFPSGGDRRELNSRVAREAEENRRQFGERASPPRRGRDGDRRRDPPPPPPPQHGGAGLQRGRSFGPGGGGSQERQGHHQQQFRADAPTEGVGAPSDPKSSGAAADRSKVKCYNCGLLGHIQMECTEEAFCVKCGVKGHLTAMCSAGEAREEPYWAGYGSNGIGFMCLEVDEEEMSKPPPNSATVYIEGAILSAQAVQEEFKELVDAEWDW